MSADSLFSSPEDSEAELALHRKMQSAIDELMAARPELVITSAGGACPFQSSGTLHGLPYYLRFRRNWATLRVGGDMHFKALYEATMQFSDADEDDLLGWLNPDEFVWVMNQLIAQLKRAPIWWEFPGIEPQDIGKIKAGTPTLFGAWGHSAEEAWQRLHEPSEFLLARGMSAEEQARLRIAERLRFETVTVDDRVFLDPDPFTTEEQR